MTVSVRKFSSVITKRVNAMQQFVTMTTVLRIATTNTMGSLSRTTILLLPFSDIGVIDVTAACTAAAAVAASSAAGATAAVGGNTNV